MERDEPSAERGWLSSLSATILDQLADPGWRTRLGIGLACALALHEILAGLVPGGPQKPQDERVVAEVVMIQKRIPTPAPTPPPTPSPTPPPKPTPTPAPHYTLAPRVVIRNPAPKAAATPTRHQGGAAAPRHLVRATPHPVPSASPRPARSLANGLAYGQNNGGAGTGAGAGTGNGGLGGTGSGTGGVGNGNGGNENAAPCADVILEPGRLTYRKDGTVEEEVFAKIVLRDGTTMSGRFPYAFVYPGEAKNPFVHADALAADGGIPVQFPPPGSDIGSMPSAVQYALQHSDPSTGFAKLAACTHDAPS